jgi:hypothetical protein
MQPGIKSTAPRQRYKGKASGKVLALGTMGRTPGRLVMACGHGRRSRGLVQD